MLVLTALAYQDFKDFEFHWAIIPVLGIGFIAKGLLNYTGESYFKVILVNFLIIAIQLGALLGYFKLRHKGKSFLDKVFGLGDVLMLLTLTFVFHPSKLLLFEVMTLIVALLGVGTHYLLKKDWAPKIPLAGIWASFLIGVLLMEQLNWVAPLMEANLSK